MRDRAERGCAVIKVMASGGLLTAGTERSRPQFTPEELHTLVDEAHRHGLPVTAHAHALDAIADAVAAGVDGIEHCSFLTSQGVRPRQDLIAAIVSRRTAVGATVGLAPAPGFAPPPDLTRLMPDLRAATRRLIAAGALVVAGTDAGIAPVKPHGRAARMASRHSPSGG